MSRRVVLFGLLSLAWVVGCGGDVSKRIGSDAELRTQVMNTIAGNPEFAGAMMDQLLASDSLRTMVTGKILSHSATVQPMMAQMAQNREIVDGILNVAVQDSSMRDHVMSLLKGMQMAGAGR